tara:strand:+ start:1262 stop:1741 length:480 start_codon:yes stop_codon:yes gene_type:complete
MSASTTLTLLGSALLWELACADADVTGGRRLDDEASGEDDERPEMFPTNDVWYSRSVIGGFVLVACVLLSIAAVLVMAAKEEDGHVMTSLISKEADRLSASLAEGMSTIESDGDSKGPASPESSRKAGDGRGLERVGSSMASTSAQGTSELAAMQTKSV